MTWKTGVLFLFGSLGAAGVVPANPPVETIDVCSLIAPEEVARIQSEAVVGTTTSSRSSGGLVHDHCFYTLPTHVNSVSLELVRRDASSPAGPGPKEHWAQLFHGPRKPGREKKEGLPIPVEEIGDEAFWSGNAMTGALYVLKGDRYLRIGVGGGEAMDSRIDKARRLAASALARL